MIALLPLFVPVASAEPVPPVGVFERPLAVGAHALGWGGAYGAGGLGGQLRYEPFRRFGVDLFAEHLLVESPSGLRHDHPVGFDAYVPVAVGPLRLRPLVGACAVGSFIRSDAPDAPGADDVLFGLHTGLGLEVPVGERFSAFATGKAVGWMGHDRAVQGWTGSVGTGLKAFAVAQVDVGAAVHFGRP